MGLLISSEQSNDDREFDLEVEIQGYFKVK